MRTILPLLVVLMGFGRAYADHAPAAPILLSYAEVMRLSKPARIAYLRDLGALLALMEEKFEGRYDAVATNDARHAREQVASLLRLVAHLPEAHAADAETIDYAKIKPEWDGQDFRCGDGKRVRFVPRVATCLAVPSNLVNDTAETPTAFVWKACPAGTRAIPTYAMAGLAQMGDYCAPQASWDLLDEKVRKRLARGKVFDEALYAKMTPEQKAALVGAPAKEELQGNSPVSDQKAKPKAPTTTATCKPPEGQAFTDLVNDFRKSESAKTCISGGFFTKKKGTGPGSCEVYRKYPKKPAGKWQIECPANEGVCNPYTFCMQVKNAVFATANGTSKPQPLYSKLCAPIGQKFSNACNKKYLATVGKAPVLSAQAKKGLPGADKLKVEACDPSSDDHPFLKTTFLDEYKLLKDETENMYNAHCTGNDGSFLALFCEECTIIGERLKKMPRPQATADAGAPGTSPTPAAGGATTTQ